MKKRTVYYNFDKDVIDAVVSAFEARSAGDVPDTTLGIISLLKINGWDIVRKDKNE